MVRSDDYHISYANLSSFTDYYPFGMPMPGRNGSYANYRMGFNGMEKDDEIAGKGNHIDFKFRGYDPRLGRFWSVDPLAKHYSYYTPYQFAGNTPIWAIDLEGAEPKVSNLRAALQEKNGSVTITADVSIEIKVFNASSNKDVSPSTVAAYLGSDLKNALNGESEAVFNLPFDFKKNSKDNKYNIVNVSTPISRTVRYNINVTPLVRMVHSIDQIEPDDWAYVMVDRIVLPGKDAKGIALGKVGFGEVSYHKFGSNAEGRNLSLHETLHLGGAEDIYDSPKDDKSNAMSNGSGLKFTSEQRAHFWRIVIGDYKHVWDGIRKNNYQMPKHPDQQEDTRKQIKTYRKSHTN